MTEAHIRRGLANRFIWVRGNRKAAPLARRPPIDKPRHQALLSAVATHLRSAAGKTYALSPSADELHAERYMQEYRREEESELIAAVSARADGMALRISLLLAVAEGTTFIERPQVEAAWQVVDYSRAVTEELIAHVGVQTRHGAETRILAAAKRVAESTGGVFTRRDVHLRVKGPTGIGSAVFETAWKALITNGELVAAGEDRWTVATSNPPNPQSPKSPIPQSSDRKPQ